MRMQDASVVSYIAFEDGGSGGGREMKHAS